MITIVPLAGPDFYTETHGIRPLYPIKGRPLIEHVLMQRPWLTSQKDSSQLIFVLRDSPAAQDAETAIRSIFPMAEFVRIPSLTRGALLSVLSGVGLIRDFHSPVIIDLADMGYRVDLDVQDFFVKDPDLGAICPYFHSSSDKYSYLRTRGDFMTEACEKKVISDRASAGTYIFRDAPTFLSAAADSIRFSALYEFRNNLFVCPALNGVLRDNKKVLTKAVEDVEEISLLFK